LCLRVTSEDCTTTSSPVARASIFRNGLEKSKIFEFGYWLLIIKSVSRSEP
jgi:hypothetical protein